MTLRIPRAAGKTNTSKTYAPGKLIAISMRAKQATAPQRASLFHGAPRAGEEERPRVQAKPAPIDVPLFFFISGLSRLAEPA